jgi:hypothetical protein
VPYAFAAAPAIRHAIKWLGNRAFRRKRGPALPGDSRSPTERPATGMSFRRSICNSKAMFASGAAARCARPAKDASHRGCAEPPAATYPFANLVRLVYMSNVDKERVNGPRADQMKTAWKRFVETFEPLRPELYRYRRDLSHRSAVQALPGAQGLFTYTRTGSKGCTLRRHALSSLDAVSCHHVTGKESKRCDCRS